MELIDALSTEYVYADVSAIQAGVVVNPTANAVQIAITTGQAAPAGGDWKNATWVTDSTGPIPTYTARLLVGPTGGAVTLTAGQRYTVWVKITAGSEIPVLRAGQIQAF